MYKHVVQQPAAGAGRDLGDDRRYGSGVRHVGVEEYVKECLPAWTQVGSDTLQGIKEYRLINEKSTITGIEK